MSILTPIKEVLDQGLPARIVSLSEEQEEFAKSNLHLLTRKPIIYVANVGEEDLLDLESSTHFQTLKKYADNEGTQVIPVSCEIEAELSSVSEEERQEYLSSINVTESGLDKVIRATYTLLNLSTFFTVGSDECRAWTFKNGMSAPECAGVIHTDFKKGFICAEVYSFESIKTYGSELACKEAGKIERKGKDYYPKDGDIMFFRFNV